MGGSGSSYERSVSGYKIAGTKYSSNYEQFKVINRANQEFMAYGRKNHGVRDLFDEAQEIRLRELQSSASRMDTEDAVDEIREGIPENVRRGWFVNADSDYKPRIYSAIMENPNLLNAGWNIAYENYVNEQARSGKPTLSFRKWLHTPQRMFRGHGNQKRKDNEQFVSYTINRLIAERFGKNVEEIKIKPIDTLGSYQTTGEDEVLIPIWKLKK